MQKFLKSNCLTPFCIIFVKNWYQFQHPCLLQKNICPNTIMTQFLIVFFLFYKFTRKNRKKESMLFVLDKPKHENKTTINIYARLSFFLLTVLCCLHFVTLTCFPFSKHSKFLSFPNGPQTHWNSLIILSMLHQTISSWESREKSFSCGEDFHSIRRERKTKIIFRFFRFEWEI